MMIVNRQHFLEENHGGPGITEREVRHGMIVNFVELQGRPG